jgi:hypothetical protein
MVEDNFGPNAVLAQKIGRAAPDYSRNQGAAPRTLDKEPGFPSKVSLSNCDGSVPIVCAL